MPSTRERGRTPVFYKALAGVFGVLAACAAAFNVYIYGRLAEYENALPKHAAQGVFAKYFAEPDFLYLLAKSDYALAADETLAGVLDYYGALAKREPLDYARVKTSSDAAAITYVVTAGETNIAEFTLVPAGKTKHGHVIYEEGAVALLPEPETDAPGENLPPVSDAAPETSAVDAAPETGPAPEPETDAEESPASAALREAFSERCIAAVRAYSLRSRNQLPKGETLAFFERGSAIYRRIDSIEYDYAQFYDEFIFENETASEFRPLTDKTFSCRVSFDFVMKKKGAADFVEHVSCVVFMRENADGACLAYDLLVEPV